MNAYRCSLFFLMSPILLGGLISCAREETVGRRAGLWASEHRSDGLLLARETESGPNRLVQHVPQASSDRKCMPEIPFTPPPEGGDSETHIRRVIRVPEAGIVVQIQVLKGEEVGLENMLVSLVQRTSDSYAEHIVQISSTTGSPNKLVSLGGHTYVRLGDCPPEMKPIELPVRAR